MDGKLADGSATAKDDKPFGTSLGYSPWRWQSETCPAQKPQTCSLYMKLEKPAKHVVIFGIDG